MTQTPFSPVLHTQSDVEDAWRRLMHPLGWPDRRLWLMLVGDDGRPSRQLTEVTDLPDLIPPDDAAGVVAMWGHLLDQVAPGGRLAVLLCRPGRGGPSPQDLGSAAALYSAGRAGGVALEVIHLATDEDVHPIPYDAVGRAGA